MNDDLLAGGDATSAARTLAVRGFAALWQGREVRVADMGVDDSVIDAQVRAGRLELDTSGRVVGVHGLVARSTPHRIEHERGVVHTWCAFDAIGIPAALGINAAAVTSCPACGNELRVTLTLGEPNSVGRWCVWFPSGPCEHLVDDFCRHTNLFCNAEHLSSVVPSNAAGRVMTVTEAATIGRSTWRDIADILGHPEQDPLVRGARCAMEAP